MAMNIVEINRIKRQLAEQVGSVTKNAQLTSTQKSVQLDEIERKMNDVRKEESLRRKFAGLNYMGSAPGHENFSDDHCAPARMKRGPVLSLDEDTMRELHGAVMKGQPAQVRTKAYADFDGLIPSALIGQPLGMVHEPDRVMSHFPVTATGAPSVEYIRHSSTTGAPTTVAAGALKPEVVLNTNTLVATARKIAAHTACTTESLADFPSFQQYMTHELTRQIIDVENQQLLLGDGTGTNLLGLLNTTGILTRAVNPGPPVEVSIETIEEAKTDIRVGASFAEANITVMHPLTWSKLRRTKDGQGRYLVDADPTKAEGNSLWGLEVVVTTVMPVGTALVAATDTAAVIYERMGIALMASSQSGTDFTSNLVRFVAEERLALAVTRPSGLCKVTGL